MHACTYQLWKFRGPKVGSDDAFLRNPVGVNIHQSILSLDTFFSLQSTNQDTIRAEQISNSSAFSQKLRVGQDLERNLRGRIGFENGTHALSSTARHSRLFNNNLGALGNFSNTTSSTFNVTIQYMCVKSLIPTMLPSYLRKISSHTSTHTSLLGRSVDRDKDKIGFIDGTIYISREEEILATTIKDNFLETRFIDGQLVRVPGSNASGIDVNDGHLDVMALVSDNSTSRATW